MAVATPVTLRRTILVLGFSGMVAHTVLLRELLILFAGNEFSVGIIIGAWIIAEAGGALAAGHLVARGQAAVRWFAPLTLLFCTFFPAVVVAVRCFKLLAGLPPDQGVGIGMVGMAALLLQLPVAALHGALFVLACALFVLACALFVLACALTAEATGEALCASGRVYTLETVGTIAGGLLAGYLIVPHIPATLAVALVAALNGAVLFPLARPRRPVAASACLLLAAGLLAGASSLEQATLRRQWQGRELVDYHNSPYQNLAVVQSGRQLTFYGDGLPLFSVPEPDIAAVEEFVHLPLLTHPAPRRVLVLGGGTGGAIAEILKHPSVDRVDYVELDPALLNIVTRHAPAASLAFLTDPRVRLHSGDIRQFLRETGARYDVILLGVPLPGTLQGNRFFTREFFTLANQALARQGLLAVAATGSLTYYGPELLAVNGSLLQTLAAAFPQRRIVPGDTNLFLAAPASSALEIDAGLLGSRLRERQLATRLITPEHLRYLLDPERQEWFRQTVAGTGAVNRDFSPRFLLDQLAYGTVLFTPQLRDTFAHLHDLPLLPLLFGLVAAGLGIGRLARRKPAMICPLVIAGTGFTAMLLELALFCAFQVLYGAMFQALALLIATFMLGLATGSWLVTDGPLAGRDDRRLLLAGDLGLLLLCTLLALLFAAPALPMEGAWRAHLLILPLLLATGLLTGWQFPLASRLQQAFGKAGHDAAQAGRVSAIFAADLLGGSLGGLVGGVILLPVFGLAGSCLLAVAGKIASVLLLFISRKTATL